MSFTRHIYHIVFATKSRRRTIVAKHKREAYQMMWDILKTLGVKVHRIGGAEEHVHILCEIPCKMNVPDVMQKVKGSSSYLMKRSGLFPMFYGWADGYFSRTCSVEEIPAVMEYIQNQESHHRIMSWREEMREFIIRMGGDPDALEAMLSGKSEAELRKEAEAAAPGTKVPG